MFRAHFLRSSTTTEKDKSGKNGDAKEPVPPAKKVSCSEELFLSFILLWLIQFFFNFALVCFFDIEMTKIWLFSFEQSRLREMVGYEDLTEEQTSEFPSLKIADSTKFSQGLIPAVPKVNQLDAKTMCARFCLVPVRLPYRPSRPIRFVDMSRTNGLFAWTT